MFHVTLKCDNAAFSDGCLHSEIARILRKLADNVDRNLGDQDDDGKLIDHNGNTVGKWSYEAL